MPKAKTPPDNSIIDDAADGASPVDPDTEKVSLEFRGQKFEVPKRRGRWPVDAVLKFGDGDLLRAFKLLLGQSDWRRLTSVAPTIDDFNEFALPAVDRLTEECTF